MSESSLSVADTRIRAAGWLRNLGRAQLYEEAIRRGEGVFSRDGALIVETGRHTGRAAKDKFIVRDAETESQVWWGAINQPMTAEHFSVLLADVARHLADRELFLAELVAGADPDYRIAVDVVTEQAWHALFARTMLIVPEDPARRPEPRFTILHAPSFRADPDRHGCRSETVIAIDFTRRVVIIAGTAYAGEIKKSVFTILNYLLPPRGVMPMHCSANVGARGDVAIFFGLSGTGKTTLSADPRRRLIGDDEHGWSDNGVFNFEGGCYAKMIRLSAEAEPEIFAAVHRFGAVLENVAYDPVRRTLDFDDASLTENTRGAYPLEFIANHVPENRAGHPENIVMLTADAFGVLPPIARLTPEQAMYHFISGYTAKVAGTEMGVTEPQATFSACFGAPFMPRHPGVYGDLLRRRIAERGVNCWLVNTGWTGGPYGVGHRMPIKATRAMLDAALSGALNDVPTRIDPNFGIAVPVAVPGVEAGLLDPRGTWPDPSAYDAKAAELVRLFNENFAPFADAVDEAIRAAAPATAEA